MKKAGNTRPERKAREGPGSKGVIPTPRQQAFALAFQRCGNAKEAAIEAGYAPGSAKQRGDKLLKQPAVVQLLNEYTRRTEEAGLLTVIEAKRILTDIARDTDQETKDRISAIDKYLRSSGAYVEKREVEHKGVNVAFVFEDNGRGPAPER